MRTLRDSSGVSQVRRDMEYFCLAVGQRLAGSPEEKAVAEYTAQRFGSMGLNRVGLLPFSCRRWHPGGCRLEVLDTPGRRIPAIQFAHSASTGSAGVEGELLLFEPVDYENGVTCTGLAGKIGLFHGMYGESAERYTQYHRLPLEALLFVDTRLQVPWPIANGMGERFMRAVRKPMAVVSLMDAWQMVRDGVRRVRLTCDGYITEATSHNVVGEIPGTDTKAAVIVVCAHLDSVAVGVGADDDASGVAAVLECVRRLTRQSHKHTIRFIAFGAEEQLSVGSQRYVSRQATDLERIGFVCNFDGIAAHLGISEVMATGTPAMDDWVRGTVQTLRHFGTVLSGVSPYQDQFPFVAKGIPGLWFTRKTDRNMYWYHHSAESNLGVCSMEQIAWTAETACDLVAELADRADYWPFPREIAPSLLPAVDAYGRELLALD